MPLQVNLRHLADRNLQLKGELPAAELDIETNDDLVQIASLLSYNLEIQKMAENLLLRGQLSITLNCQCVRCLKPLIQKAEIADWLGDVPLAGDDKAPIVNDCVDLTPYLREDILLAFPQHPLCEPECGGLKTGKKKEKTEASQPKSSAWSELDKLKL